MKVKKRVSGSTGQIVISNDELGNAREFYLNTSRQFQELALGAAIMANDFNAFQVFAPLIQKPLTPQDIEYLYKMLRYVIGHDANPHKDLILAALAFAPELKTYHAPGDGATLLHAAAFHNKEVSNLLIRNGFNMLDKTASGDTVMHFASLRQQVKGSTLQIPTENDKALLNLAKLRSTLFLGLYDQGASNQKRIEYFQNTIKYAGKFGDFVEQYCHESISEVLMCLINIHSISSDLNPLGYFSNSTGQNKLDTMHQIATAAKDYENLYEICRTYGLLSYACLAKGDREKAIKYTSKMLNVPSDMTTELKKDFALVLSNTAARWISLDPEFAEKIISVAETLDPSSDEIKMRHLMFYYNKVDISGMKKIAHTFDSASDIGKVAIAECVFAEYGTSKKVFECVFGTLCSRIDVDNTSFDLNARSIFYSRLLEYHAIRKDEEAFALTSLKILHNDASTIDFGLIISYALSAMIYNNFTSPYLQIFSEFFKLHPEHQQSTIPYMRFAEFYCKLHYEDNLAAAAQALSELKRWSTVYTKVKGLYTYANDLYLAHKIDNAIGESDFDSAARYAKQLHELSTQNKYLSVIKVCSSHEPQGPKVALDTAASIVLDKDTSQSLGTKSSTTPADASTELQHVLPTLAAQLQLSKDNIFEALRLTSGDSEEYQQLIMRLSPSEVHQYYTELKAQILRNAINSCGIVPKIPTWYHKDIRYQSDNPEIVHIEGTEKCYATIKCEIDGSLRAQFASVLDHIVSRKHGSNGVKYVSEGKCIELKINGDNRLWTTEELVNPEGDILLVFDHNGNHVSVANLPNHALHTVYTDVPTIGDISCL